MSSYCDSSLGKTPISVTNRSASGMRDWSRSRGSIARSWTEKPCSVGQRANSARIFTSTSASRRTRRLSARPGLKSRVFICSAFTQCCVTAHTTEPWRNRDIGHFPSALQARPENGNCYTNVKNLVQGPCEGASAQKLGRVRLFFEEFGQRAGDVLENLPVLLGRQTGRDAYVGNEKLVVFGAHREAP